MDVSSLLLELYGRIPPLARHAVESVDLGRLTEPPASGANPIAWLVWHLARVQDHHIVEILDTDQLWVGGDWAPRFGLGPGPGNTGYGHSPEEVAAVRPERPEVLHEPAVALAAGHGPDPPCPPAGGAMPRRSTRVKKAAANGDASVQDRMWSQSSCSRRALAISSTPS